MKNLKKYLESLHACNESIKWADSRQASHNAWLACPRADWLAWLAGKIGIDKNLIILATCDVAESVLHLVSEDEERPRKAVETARAFVAGKATKQEVRAAYATAYAARDAARDAAHAAAGAAAYYAADAAAVAAAAANYAAYAVGAAYAVAVYAANANVAAATDRDSVWFQKQKELADIVRKRIPWNIWQKTKL